MTDVEYLETACNAFALGIRPFPSAWSNLTPAARLVHAKGLHAELLKSDKAHDIAFRKMNRRLFPVASEALKLLRPSLVFSVVFWVPVLHVGGADQWVVSLCKHFDRRKIRPLAVCVLDPREINPFMAARMPNDVPILLGRENFLPATEHANAVISWGLRDLPSLSKGILATKPVIHVLHHPPEYQLSDLLFTPDAGIHQVAVNPRFAGAASIGCVENGAEVDRALPLGDREAERARLGIAANEKLVLYLGRLTSEKNVPQIIRAVDSLPSYRLLVCGPQQFRPTDWPKSDKVIYHPQIDHLGGVLAAADCLALPSSFESHGLAKNEAELVGLPVVSAAYSANLDFRERYGELSWLVPLPVEAGALAEQIVLACNGRSDARVKRAKDVANEFYTAEKMARRWESYLAGVRRDAITNPS